MMRWSDTENIPSSRTHCLFRGEAKFSLKALASVLAEEKAI
jgi:hypothetical protein